MWKEIAAWVSLPVFGLVIGHVLGRKKNKAEIDLAEAEVMHTNVSTIKDLLSMLDGLKNQLTTLLEELMGVKKENRMLREEVQRLHIIIDQLEKFIVDLKKQLELKSVIN